MTTEVAGGCGTTSERIDTGRMSDARWITASKSRPTYVLARPGDVAATAAEMAELVLRHASREGAVLLLFDAACLGQYIEQVLMSIGVLTQPKTRATAGSSASGTFQPLTRKEANVLRLLAEGQSNSAMAANLCISDSTVRTHVRNISAKLNTHSRTQAVAIARKLGLIIN
jgi:DNA-binding NarL/FixJ family response regulator